MMNLNVKEMTSIPSKDTKDPEDAAENQAKIDNNAMKPPGMSDLEWKKAQLKANYPSPGKY